jgi:hypothetical protein
MPHVELQQALLAVSTGSVALRHAARAQGFTPFLDLPEGFTTHAVLAPLRRLQAILGGQEPLVTLAPAIRAKRAPRATAARSGIPKPVDLGGLDRRLPRVPDNRMSRGRPDPQLEASNCRALLLEVIRRAAYDWVLYRGSSKLPNRLLAESAYQWLFVEEPGSVAWVNRSKHGKELMAFVAICSQLDIDPDRMRATVRTMTERDIMGAGRPAERRRGKAGDEVAHGDDLRVFDVDVDLLPVFDCMFAPEPLGG